MRYPLVRSVLISAAAVAFGATSFASCPSLTWTAGQEMAVNRYFRHLAVIDYDQDGISDLAGTLDGPPGTIATFRGLGNGTFAAPVVIFTSSSPNVHGTLNHLSTADVNGDGRMDLLAQYSSSLLIFHGTASGLGQPVQMYTDYSLRAFTAGNFDSDPATELVGVGNSRIVVYDNAAGSFVETRRVTDGTYHLSGVVSADFDADGRHDVAVSRYTTTSTPGAVDVFFRNADGTFSAPLVLPAGIFPSDLATADVDSDGRPDLAVVNWQDTTVTVYRNHGSRHFTASTMSARYPERYGNATTVVIRDVTADGVPDLLVGTVNGGWLATFAGVGDGTFHSASYVLGFDQLYDFALGDFDSDGDLDVAMGGYEKLIIASPSCATQVTLSPEAPLVSANAEATLNVAIAGFRPAIPQPYGTVTLRKGAQTMGTSTPNAAGRASFVVPPMTAGDHTFTAEFSGNAEVSGATSNSVTQKVTNATTQTTLVTPATPPVYGTPWPIDAIVTGSGAQQYEFVRIYVDGVPVDHYNYYPFNAYLTPGEHTIYAKFLGRTSSPASLSETLVVTAQKATPSFDIAGTAPVRLGQPHALQFNLGGPAGAFTPTGTVQLFSGATEIANLALSGGTAATSMTLPRGAHVFRAVYSGDGYYQASEKTVTLHVLPNHELAIEARGTAAGIQIVHVAPPWATTLNLFRRVTGAPAWQFAAWNTTTGIDTGAAQPGVVYEYYLEASGSGNYAQSAIDNAMLFTDDPIAAGATPIRRVHFNQLRDAVNLLRVRASLAPFDFDATFHQSNLIRAQHLLSLQAAASQARSALGMAAPQFDAFTNGSVINAAHVRQTRDAVR